MAHNVGTVHVMCEKLSWTRLTCLLIAQCGSKDGSGSVHLLKGMINSPFVVGNNDLALCELQYCSTRMKYRIILSPGRSAAVLGRYTETRVLTDFVTLNAFA